MCKNCLTCCEFNVELQYKYLGFADCSPEDFYKTQWSKTYLPLWSYKLCASLWWMVMVIIGLSSGPDHDKNDNHLAPFHVYITSWAQAAIALYYFVSFCTVTYGLFVYYPRRRLEEDISNTKAEPTDIDDILKEALTVVSDGENDVYKKLNIVYEDEQKAIMAGNETSVNGEPQLNVIMEMPKELIDEVEKNKSIKVNRDLQWFHKLTWMLQTVASDAPIMNFLCYVIFPPDVHTAFSLNNAINSIIFVFVDMFLVANPVRFLHLFHAVIYAILYCFYSLAVAYHGLGYDAIYPVLNWSEKTNIAVLVCLGFCFVIAPFAHLLFWLLYCCKVLISRSVKQDTRMKLPIQKELLMLETAPVKAQPNRRITLGRRSDDDLERPIHYHPPHRPITPDQRRPSVTLGRRRSHSVVVKRLSSHSSRRRLLSHHSSDRLSSMVLARRDSPQDLQQFKIMPEKMTATPEGYQVSLNVQAPETYHWSKDVRIPVTLKEMAHDFENTPHRPLIIFAQPAPVEDGSAPRIREITTSSSESLPRSEISNRSKVANYLLNNDYDAIGATTTTMTETDDDDAMRVDRRQDARAAYQQRMRSRSHASLARNAATVTRLTLDRARSAASIDRPPNDDERPRPRNTLDDSEVTPLTGFFDDVLNTFANFAGNAAPIRRTTLEEPYAAPDPSVVPRPPRFDVIASSSADSLTSDERLPPPSPVPPLATPPFDDGYRPSSTHAHRSDPLVGSRRPSAAQSRRRSSNRPSSLHST